MNKRKMLAGLIVAAVLAFAYLAGTVVPGSLRSLYADTDDLLIGAAANEAAEIASAQKQPGVLDAAAVEELGDPAEEEAPSGGTVAETPAAETPAAETPTAETPTAETPSAETPAAEAQTETPAAEAPPAESAAVSQSLTSPSAESGNSESGSQPSEPASSTAAERTSQNAPADSGNKGQNTGGASSAASANETSAVGSASKEAVSVPASSGSKSTPSTASGSASSGSNNVSSAGNATGSAVQSDTSGNTGNSPSETVSAVSTGSRKGSAAADRNSTIVQSVTRSSSGLIQTTSGAASDLSGADGAYYAYGGIIHPAATSGHRRDAKAAEHTIKIYYENALGIHVADTYFGSFEEGKSYEVVSPEVEGYSATVPVVSGKADGDREYTVLYNLIDGLEELPEVTHTVDGSGNADYIGALAGCIMVEKNCAMVNAPCNVNVREGEERKSRIIGILHPGDFCYILAGEGENRVYVESNMVRGFVDGCWLDNGSEVESLLKAAESRGVLPEGTAVVSPEFNKALLYTLTTTRDISKEYQEAAVTSADRQAMITYAQQFIGTPWVEGGGSLKNGCDGVNFSNLVYRTVGIVLPRDLFEQSSFGSRVNPSNAFPGDLLFYFDGNDVSQVLLYLGNGKALTTSEELGAITMVDVDYSKAFQANHILSDDLSSSTQAEELTALGSRANVGDDATRQQLFDIVATAADQEWNRYGYLKSVLIAQTIEQTEWFSFFDVEGGIQASDNNVLAIPVDFLNDRWESPWTGSSAVRIVLGEETEIRTYSDVESCLADYAAFMVGVHPELAGETDVDTVLLTALGSGGQETDYTKRIRQIIDQYNLTMYDPVLVEQAEPEEDVLPDHADGSYYTEEQMELLWAIVGQEDDTSYEGALAVISSAMNRADINYGGYGMSAIEQLTAPGQYCYSPEISDPSFWQRRLGGNVADFVKQAVSDCLNGGIRNHGYINFRSYGADGRVRIGSNWYFS
ncbi:MAG: C40 family peptidase [Lachnospiraceae bacterium]|nr:C40 family peptidase [Lachnospiraceae bacterium]